MTATPWATIGDVVGENVRRLREAAGLTQNEAARMLRANGLPSWTRSQIAGLEAGKRESVDPGTLVMLASAFSVKVADLFAGEGNVRFSDEVGCTREMLRRAFSGEPIPEEGWTLTGAAEAAFLERFRGAISVHTVSAPFQADAELAGRLGVTPDDVISTARRLWGRTLHEERDHRVAELGELSPSERRVRRGHVTRQLAKDLENALAESATDGERTDSQDHTG